MPFNDTLNALTEVRVATFLLLRPLMVLVQKLSLVAFAVHDGETPVGSTCTDLLDITKQLCCMEWFVKGCKFRIRDCLRGFKLE